MFIVVLRKNRKDSQGELPKDSSSADGIPVTWLLLTIESIGHKEMNRHRKIKHWKHGNEQSSGNGIWNREKMNSVIKLDHSNSDDIQIPAKSQAYLRTGRVYTPFWLLGERCVTIVVKLWRGLLALTSSEQFASELASESDVKLAPLGAAMWRSEPTGPVSPSWTYGSSNDKEVFRVVYSFGYLLVCFPFHISHPSSVEVYWWSDL